MAEALAREAGRLGALEPTGEPARWSFPCGRRKDETPAAFFHRAKTWRWGGQEGELVFKPVETTAGEKDFEVSTTLWAAIMTAVVSVEQVSKATDEMATRCLDVLGRFGALQISGSQQRDMSMNSKVTALYCALSEVERALPPLVKDKVADIMAQQRLGTRRSQLATGA
mgnify:CR=1 FL=1